LSFHKRKRRECWKEIRRDATYEARLQYSLFCVSVSATCLYVETALLPVGHVIGYLDWCRRCTVSYTVRNLAGYHLKTRFFAAGSTRSSTGCTNSALFGNVRDRVFLYSGDSPSIGKRHDVSTALEILFNRKEVALPRDDNRRPRQLQRLVRRVTRANTSLGSII